MTYVFLADQSMGSYGNHVTFPLFTVISRLWLYLILLYQIFHSGNFKLLIL